MTLFLLALTLFSHCWQLKAVVGGTVVRTAEALRALILLNLTRGKEEFLRSWPLLSLCLPYCSEPIELYVGQ